jgi:hypothetical protein
LQAAEQAALGGDPVEHAEALALAAMARAWTGSLEGVPELEASLQLALDARSPSSTGHAFQFLCELLTVGGQTHRALEVALRGMEVCERLAWPASTDPTRGERDAAVDLGAGTRSILSWRRPILGRSWG